MIKEIENDDYFLYCDVCGNEITRDDNLDALFLKGQEDVKDFGKVIINGKLCDICKDCIENW